MIIETPTPEQIGSLLSLEQVSLYHSLLARIDADYDVDHIRSKGFGDWTYEYKYRRGGKTFRALYIKKDNVTVLVALGKAERDKFEAEKDMYSDTLNTLYETTPALHDERWI